MKRLDDIRGLDQEPHQPIQPKRQSIKQAKQQRISQPNRAIRAFKPQKILALFKWPILFIWQKKTIILSTVLILFIGTTAALMFKTQKNQELQNPEHKLSDAEKLKQVVITDDTKLAVNFTFNLKMIINNQSQAIPAGYGKIEDKRFIFNTDTSTGDIHVESPKKEAYTLNDFFVLWGSQFNSTCLLNHCLGGSGSLTMTVNGDINPEFGNYVIREGDQIVITYNDIPITN